MMQLQGTHTSTLMMIPSGKEGIIATLKIMRQCVRDGKKTLAIRVKAMELLQGIPPKHWGAEISALFYFVRDDVRFTRDIRGVETIQTPDKTLEFGQGDCDDKSTLLASLLESVGHPTRFVAVGFQPGEYEHVYVETRFGEGWLPLETTDPVEPGWYPPGVVSKLVIHN